MQTSARPHVTLRATDSGPAVLCTTIENRRRTATKIPPEPAGRRGLACAAEFALPSTDSTSPETRPRQRRLRDLGDSSARVRVRSLRVLGGLDDQREPKQVRCGRRRPPAASTNASLLRQRARRARAQAPRGHLRGTRLRGTARAALSASPRARVGPRVARDPAASARHSDSSAGHARAVEHRRLDGQRRNRGGGGAAIASEGARRRSDPPPPAPPGGGDDARRTPGPGAPRRRPRREEGKPRADDRRSPAYRAKFFRAPFSPSIFPATRPAPYANPRSCSGCCNLSVFPATAHSAATDRAGTSPARYPPGVRRRRARRARRRARAPRRRAAQRRPRGPHAAARRRTRAAQVAPRTTERRRRGGRHRSPRAFPTATGRARRGARPTVATPPPLYVAAVTIFFFPMKPRRRPRGHALACLRVLLSVSSRRARGRERVRGVAAQERAPDAEAVKPATSADVGTRERGGDVGRVERAAAVGDASGVTPRRTLRVRDLAARRRGRRTSGGRRT